jgi:hypothetical protein
VTNQKVLIVDDDQNLAEVIERNVLNGIRTIRTEYTTSVLAEETLRKEIRILLDRRETLGKKANRITRGESQFDDARIVVIDYDLAPLFQSEALMTGEILASLVRQFSWAGPIISVNRFGKQKFMLTLFGESRGWADLNVSHEDLGNSGLWSHTWKRYRPWSWPVLSELPTLFDQRVAHCRKNPKQKIVEALRIPKAVARVFPRRAADALGDLGSVTFADLVHDRQPPKSPRLPPELSARVAASETGKWLEQTVLPGQDILIDPPHLAMLFPSLLTIGDESAALDRLANLHPGTRLAVKGKLLTSASFNSTFRLTRAAWWTELVLSSSSIPEVADPTKRQSLKRVFAEDTSRFHPRKDCIQYSSEGLFPTRWLRRPDNSIPYEPAGRLAI